MMALMVAFYATNHIRIVEVIAKNLMFSRLGPAEMQVFFRALKKMCKNCAVNPAK